MSSFKQLLKTNFEVEAKCDPFFTGTNVEITKDGDFLICECGNNVGILSTKSGNIDGRITFEEDFVTAISLSPDNSTFVAALKSGNIQQYGWPSRDLSRTFKSYHYGPVNCLGWDASSTFLISGAADSSARVWDLRQKFCTHSLKAEGIFRVVLFDHDLNKKPYAYGASGNHLYRWKLNQGSSTLVTKYEGHHGQVTSLILTDDSSSLVSAGLDRVIILWSVEEGTQTRLIPMIDSISAILLKPPGVCLPNVTEEVDNIFALAVGDKGLFSVWNVEKGSEVWRSSEPIVGCGDNDGTTSVHKIIYNDNLKSIIFTTFDNNILFTHPNDLASWKQFSGYNEQVLDCIFVGDNDSHLVVVTNSPQLRLYDCSNKSCHFIKGHKAIPLSLTKHPKHPTIFASSSHDNTIRVWKLTSNGTTICIAVATGHLQSIGGVAFGQGFLVSGSKDLSVKLWPFPKDIVENIPVAPISLVSSHTVIEHTKDINTITVAVNNKLVATGSQDRTAKIFNAKTLVYMGVLSGHKRGIWCVQFSPVDEIIATASADAEIKIWSLTDYSNLKTLQEHDAGVLRVAWLSHGLQLLSSASDGLIKLWTVKTGVCAQTFDQHEDKAWALAVSADEEKIVSGGEDSTIIWWKDVTKEEQQKSHDEMMKLAADEQSLLNLMHDKKWTKALAIAIRLNQPHRGLKIIREILDQCPSELDSVIFKLREDQLTTLLNYCVQWNTKSKSAREAQKIINTLLKHKTPQELESISDWKTILEGLLPFTDRHFKRVSSLAQASQILFYMSAQINLTKPTIYSEKSNDTRDSVGESNSDSEESNASAMEVSENVNSLENLDNDYIIEKVVASSSDEESMDEE